jgi:hypothetical protein
MEAPLGLSSVTPTLVIPEWTDIGRCWQRRSMIETGMVMKFSQQS